MNVRGESENLMQTILDSSSEGCFTLDCHWRFTYLNKAMLLHFLRQKADLLDQVIWAVFPELEYTTMGAELKRAATSNTPAAFTAYFPAGRKQLFFRVLPQDTELIVYVSDGCQQLMDLSPLSLRSHYKKLFKASTAALSVLRCRDWRYLQVNPAWEKSAGISCAEAVGQTPIELGLLCEWPINWKMRFIPETGRVERNNLMIRTRTTGLKQVNILAELILLDGDPCVVVATKDSSEKNYMEAELARLDRLNLVGEMAASIGHEVRNPMTTVRGFLQVLRLKSDLASYAPHFDLMVDELDRANSIISEFLSIAKNKPAEPKQGLIGNVVNTLIPLLDANAIMSGKGVIYEGVPVPPILMTERDIRQLILNLVRNGLEVSPRGGSVRIRTYLAEGQVVLAVADQGTGIPLEVQSKLYTAFFTTKETGTGLGLVVCRQIVERHNANISFVTGPQGTTFSVVFPLACD